ncbi:MAG: WD40 repeat domain-containing protein, partial [Chthoniobacterales bacterium]
MSPRTKFPRFCAAALFGCASIAGAAEPELPPEATGRLGSHGFVHPETVLQLAFIEDDRRIVSNCGDDFLRIWDVEFAKVLQQVPEKSTLSQRANARIPARVKRSGINGPTSIASADGRFVASGGNSDGMLRDAVTKKVIAKLPGETRALEFSPDGRLLAAAMEDAPVTDKSWYDALKVIDTSTGLEKWQSREGYHQVAFSPDGTLLAASGFERVAIFD